MTWPDVGLVLPHLAVVPSVDCWEGEVMTTATRIQPEKLQPCLRCPEEGPAVYVACWLLITRGHCTAIGLT